MGSGLIFAAELGCHQCKCRSAHHSPSHQTLTSCRSHHNKRFQSTNNPILALIVLYKLARKLNLFSRSKLERPTKLEIELVSDSYMNTTFAILRTSVCVTILIKLNMANYCYFPAFSTHVLVSVWQASVDWWLITRMEAGNWDCMYYPSGKPDHFVGKELRFYLNYADEIGRDFEPQWEG